MIQTNRIWKIYQNKRIRLPILENGTFILLYSKVPHDPALKNTLDTIQAATLLPLKLGKIKGLWKKFIESEKNYQNIRKTLAIPRNGSSFYHIKNCWKSHPQRDTSITIKNYQIRPYNLKTVNTIKIVEAI